MAVLDVKLYLYEPCLCFNKNHFYELNLIKFYATNAYSKKQVQLQLVQLFLLPWIFFFKLKNEMWTS